MKPKAKAASKSAAKSTAKSTVKAKAAKASKSSTVKKVATGLAAVAAHATKSNPKTNSKKIGFNGLFAPLDDRLIVQEFEAETRTAGGLFIPDTADVSNGPKHGTVLAVGRGHQDKKGRIRPLDVKLGDTVLFEAFMGSPIKIGDLECIVIRESQLLGVVNS